MYSPGAVTLVILSTLIIYVTYLHVFGGSTWAGFNGKTIEPPQAGSTELAVQILSVVRTLLISVLDTHFV